MDQRTKRQQKLSKEEYKELKTWDRKKQGKTQGEKNANRAARMKGTEMLWPPNRTERNVGPSIRKSIRPVFFFFAVIRADRKLDLLPLPNVGD